jgi:hypothetical protein
MIKIHVPTANVDKFEMVKRRIKESGDKQYRQRVFAIVKDALEVSAQWSGDWVSNFHLVRQGAGDVSSYKQWPGKAGRNRDGTLTFAVHQAGDPEAVNFAMTRARFVAFGIGDKVVLYNPAPLVFSGKTVTGPDGQERDIRPENLISGGVRLGAYLSAKYGGAR